MDEKKVKLIVKKEEGSIPGAGFHYMLIPILTDNEAELMIWEQMGHIIIEVPKTTSDRLLHESGISLRHQVEVAVFTEKQIAKKPEGAEMKTINALASEIAKREGKKSQARIGDIREILGILSDMVFADYKGLKVKIRHKQR